MKQSSARTVPADGPVDPAAAYPTQMVAELAAAFVPQTLRYLGVPEDALFDAAQDALVVALRRIGDFEGRSSLKTWVYSICIRVAQEHRRKHKNRRELLVDALPEVTAPPGQEEAVEKTEFRRTLDAVLDTLSEQQREAFVLFEIQRLTMKEVAEALQCPLATAYFRHKVARQCVLDAFRQRATEDAHD